MKPQNAGSGLRRRVSYGQSIVLLALALPILTGIISLASDVANYYFSWFKIQRGADSAVLSGAVYLPAYPDLAIATAHTYAQSNGVAVSEITSTSVSAGNTQLSMQVTRTVPFYFSRVLGLSSGVVKASATAQVISVGKADGVVPFGIDYQTPRTKGQTVMLHYAGNPNWVVGPGNWDPLAINGNGASNYQYNIINGAPVPLSVGQIISTETGNMKGPTQSAVNTRISNGLTFDPAATFDTHQLNDPRVITVPMVDFTGTNGHSPIPVKGFAELWLVSVNGSADVTTYFIEQTAPNTTPQPGVETFGAYTPLLIQ
jgi:hypothetical protein